MAVSSGAVVASSLFFWVLPSYPVLVLPVSGEAQVPNQGSNSYLSVMRPEGLAAVKPGTSMTLSTVDLFRPRVPQDVPVAGPVKSEGDGQAADELDFYGESAS